MSAYLVVDTKIHNLVIYQEYMKLAKPIAEKYGGIYRVRGGTLDVRESELWAPTRVVIIDFSELSSAQAFLDSDEYTPVKAMRLISAKCTLFIIDGN
jgi:uncharacterized protein (DUF1330 family)